jgi:hypothetical protein
VMPGKASMSESGSNSDSGRIRATSVHPPTADMRRLHRHVGFVPQTDMAVRFNDSEMISYWASISNRCRSASRTLRKSVRPLS